MPRCLCLTIPGPSLEGNPLGSPVERELNVYLPPGYHEEPGRRHGARGASPPWQP